MTKKEIKLQLDSQSECGKFWNSTAIIGGIKVARVCWLTNQYRVIPINHDFDDVSSRQYKPIAEFYYQDDLINYIQKTI